MSRLSEPNRVLIAVAIIGILILTLTPSANGPPEPFSYCIGCGSRWLADAILNCWMFVPLGLVAGWRARSPFMVAIGCLCFSIGIELAQTLVPGRDPGLSDVVSNSGGAIVGVLVARRRAAWIRPTDRAAAFFAAAGALVFGVVILATAVLLSPLGSSYSFGRVGDELRLRYTSRASAIGLDQPEYWLRGVFQTPGSTAAPVQWVRRRGAKWEVEVGKNQAVTMGPTVGQGWTLIAYPDAIGRHWSHALNALWMFALTVPIGFWARAKVLALAAAVAALLVLLIPPITGVVDTSFGEWAGGTLGILAGRALGRLTNRKSAIR